MSARDEDLQRVKDATNVLAEYFDSVQIFATRYEGGDDGGTVNLQYGNGNWFARYGQVASWVKMQEDRSIREDARHDGED